jgi:hypothetical protein
MKPTVSPTSSPSATQGLQSFEQVTSHARQTHNLKLFSTGSVLISSILNPNQTSHYFSAVNTCLNHDTFLPTSLPTAPPTFFPSLLPTLIPTALPSSVPTIFPSIPPTVTPSTSSPTISPTVCPSLSPSNSPSSTPTTLPTVVPSPIPSTTPSFAPSTQPSQSPTFAPSTLPTFQPSTPTVHPTFAPSNPTFIPTAFPTNPTFAPTFAPSTHPTLSPTSSPSVLPTLKPTTLPTTSPTCLPSTQPTFAPSTKPSTFPTYTPTSAPTQVYPIQNQFNLISVENSKCVSTGNGVSDLYWPGVIEGNGTAQWNQLLRQNEENYQSTILKTVFVHFLGAQCTNCPNLDTFENQFSCSDTSVLETFYANLVTRKTETLLCETNSWKTALCSNNKFKFCVNCENPCDCTQLLTTLPYDTECEGVSGGSDVGGHAYSFCESIYTFSNSPTFHIVKISPQQSPTTGVVVEVNVTEEGDIFCSALSAIPTPTSISTIDQLKNAEHVVSTYGMSAGNYNLTFTNLNPGTTYQIYCFTQSPATPTSTSGTTSTYSTTPLSDVIEKMKEIVIPTQTSLSLSLETYVTTQGEISTLELSIDGTLFATQTTTPVPIIALHTSANKTTGACDLLTHTQLLQYTGNSSSQNKHLLYPSEISFTPNVAPPQLHTVLFQPQAVGCYYLYPNTSLPVILDSPLMTKDSSALVLQSFALDEILPTPSLFSSQLSADGLTISIRFDSPTNRAEHESLPFPCLELFIFALADNSTCQFLSDVEVRVNLLPMTRDLLSTNRTLLLKPGLISPHCPEDTNCGTVYSSTSVPLLIQFPTNPITPQVVINAPTLLPLCSFLRLSYENSMGHGYVTRWASVHWTVKDLRGTILVTLTEQLNSGVLETCPGGSTTCHQIPSGSLPADQSYIFLLQLTNFLGQTSTGYVTVTVSNDALPYLQLDTGFYSTRYANETISLTSSIDLPSCLGTLQDSSYQSTWTVKKNSIIDTSVSDQSTLPWTFQIAANTLSPDTLYSFEVSLVSKGMILRTTVSSIFILPNTATVQILGGEVQQYSTLDAISLTSAVLPSSSQNSVSYAWTCVVLSPLLGPCPLSSIDRAQSTLEIPPSTLESDTIYSFTLSISSSTSGEFISSSRQIQIHTSLSSTLSYPSTQVTLSRLKFNVGEEVILSSTLLSENSFNASWRLVSPSTTLLEVSYVGGSAVEVQFPYRLPTSFFTFAGAYIFELAVKPFDCQSCGSVQTLVSIEINSGPLIGSFDVSPHFGFSDQTLFTMTVSNCLESDLPLSFTFGSISPSPLLFRSKDLLSEFSSLLPIGELTLQVIVSDCFDATSAALTTAQVMPTTYSTQQLLINTLTVNTNNSYFLLDYSRSTFAISRSITAIENFLKTTTTSTTSTALAPIYSLTEKFITYLDSSLTQQEVDLSTSQALTAMVEVSLQYSNSSLIQLSTSPLSLLQQMVDFATALTDLVLLSSPSQTDSMKLIQSLDLLNQANQLKPSPDSSLTDTLLSSALSLIDAIESKVLIGESVIIQMNSFDYYASTAIGWAHELKNSDFVSPSSSSTGEWTSQIDYQSITSSFDLTHISYYQVSMRSFPNTSTPVCEVPGTVCEMISGDGVLVTQFVIVSAQLDTPPEMTYFITMEHDHNYTATLTHFISTDSRREELFCGPYDEVFMIECLASETYGITELLRVDCPGQNRTEFLTMSCPLYDTVTFCGTTVSDVSSSCQVDSYDGVYTTCECNATVLETTTRNRHRQLSLTSSNTQQSQQRRMQTTTPMVNYAFETSNSILLGKKLTFPGVSYQSTAPPSTSPTTPAPSPATVSNRNAPQSFIQTATFTNILIPILVICCFFCLLFLAYREYNERSQLKRYVSHNNFFSKEQHLSLLNEAKRLRKEGELEESEVMYRRAAQVLEVDQQDSKLAIHPSLMIETYTGLAEVLTELGETIDSIYYYERAHRVFQEHWNLLSSSHLSWSDLGSSSSHSSSDYSDSLSGSEDSKESKEGVERRTPSSRRTGEDGFAGWYSASDTSSEPAGDLDQSKGSAGDELETSSVMDDRPHSAAPPLPPPLGLPSFTSTTKHRRHPSTPPPLPQPPTPGHSYLPTLNQMRSLPSFSQPLRQPGGGDDEEDDDGVDDSGSSDAQSQSIASTVDSQSTVDTAGINETISYYGQEISRKSGTVQNLTIGTEELYMWRQESNEYTEHSFYESTGDNEISQSFSTML